MSLQWAVYFITVFLFLYNDATDVQTIRIHYSNRKVGSYLVQLHKPLAIVFEHFVNVNRCSYGFPPDITRTYKHYDSNNGFAVLNIPFVTVEMSTQWECESPNHLIVFNIRAKGAYGVNVTVAGQIVTFESTNKSVEEYDGIYKYSCEVGDTIDITCSNLYNKGHIILQYNDAQGIEIIGTCDAKSPLTFRMLVRHKNVSRTYVDCTYRRPLGSLNYKYRIMFQVTSKNDGFIVTINDMKLTRTARGVGGKDTYVYKFLYMEHLKLTCSKKNELQGVIYGKIIENNNKTIVMTDVVNTSRTFTTVIETANLDGVIFQCHYKTERYNILPAEITFLKEPNRETYILGLSARNILFEYNTGENKWITHYQYTFNQILNLTCITNRDRSLYWIYGERIASPMRVNTDYGTRYMTFAFYMDPESNETITCESTGSNTVIQRTNIVLHLIPDLLSPENDLNIDRGTDIHENRMDGQFTLLEIIVIVVGILLITVVCAFYLWRSKRNAQVTKKKQLCSSSQDDNRVNELTDQRQSHEYACIEYNDITHRGALAANQRSGSSVKAPAPPPRLALPSKSTRSQMLPLPVSRHNDMEQCRCAKKDDNLIPATIQRKDLEDKFIENEYDYVYGGKRRKKN